ncbi:unnamed protein product [Hermetia illucens]|uniref:ubiquitinyl hydrolase 1 n=1 Tax=Hermetia illucens TaxID=343691 RepID=A0A7R8UV00_HERIL|nr:OTU domain-containing protein 7B-like [Hermetia illucens]XP_037914960.1 OTU domain-containing protein 7B-like [Hermetia illucens]CAD7087607.1 unnamed protein product [Hermetia illucens]
MRSQLISEFIAKTGSTEGNAVRCLETWDWNVNKAVTDYNDTYGDRLGRTIGHFSSPEEDSIQAYGISEPSNMFSHNMSTSNSSANKKLLRGISHAGENATLVPQKLTEMAMDWHKLPQKSGDQSSSLDTPDYTFILPDISNYSEEFQRFLEKDLIDCTTLNALEQTKRLNWWCETGICRKLWPLATTGDGNCLLHAASLGMWGFHDRKLTLRSALYDLLTKGECRHAIYRRWRFQQTRFNKEAGFVYSESEWTKEWKQIVTMASPEPRNSYVSMGSGQCRSSFSEKNKMLGDPMNDVLTYESLEEIHILALAHVLRRTIIVISETVLRDSNGEAMAPISFGGIYLPFEINSIECNRGPLLLVYDMAHFSALVPMESSNDVPPALVPLVDCNNTLFPIQFCIDPGNNFDWSNYDGTEGNWTLTEQENTALLREYLDILYAGSSFNSEEEIYENLTDDESDKKFIESEVTISSNAVDAYAENSSNRGKAAKQLQNVAKQFGSIGKSMSKKIRKNIGSITKLGNKNVSKKEKLPGKSTSQNFSCTRILCARLRIKRHQFQEAMIRNYLESAKSRFQESQLSMCVSSPQTEKTSNAELDNVYYCSNLNCKYFNVGGMHQLCNDCYEKERNSELFLNNTPRYGTGKSKFYTHADANSHESIRHLVPVRRLSEMDQTLYLSNSTFYNDALPPIYDEEGIPRSRSLYRHGYSPPLRANELEDNDSAARILNSVCSPRENLNLIALRSVLTNSAIERDPASSSKRVSPPLLDF